jgi:DNA-binding response OmpR family regulator
MKILLADSDHDALDLTTYALERRGHRVVPARNSQQAWQSWQCERTDLCILAESLPPAGGLDLCRRIRATTLAPVIVYGNGHGEEAILNALESGADDYLAVPFSLQQLLLRIEVHSRRLAATAERQPPAIDRVRLGDLALSLASFMAEKNAHPLHLTPFEFRLLYDLAQNAGTVVAAETLMRNRRRPHTGGETTILKTHISHIRAKLAAAGGTPIEIRAIPHVGYMLVLPQNGHAIMAGESAGFTNI